MLSASAALARHAAVPKRSRGLDVHPGREYVLPAHRYAANGSLRHERHVLVGANREVIAVHSAFAGGALVHAY